MSLERQSGCVRLAVTLGDPAGIGPEVVLKALADPQLRSQAEFTLVGHLALLQQAYDSLAESGVQLANPAGFQQLDIAVDPAIAAQVKLGIGNAASGDISFRSLQMAIVKTISGRFDGIITAPIAKSAWKLAGHHYPGQTELLAEGAGRDRFGMLFIARSPHSGWQLRTLLATTHIPLAQVPATLSPALMTRKLDLLIECLQQDFALAQPRIAIAGLNPHSGEAGQLGSEEQDWLTPWLQQQRQRYPQLTLDGPIPPDTLWVKPGQAWAGRQPPAHDAYHDAYLALYHDQGLIPVKLLAFDRAVNTTIGLPFVRTSPDHGTAFDIAGQGIAEATSMTAAIELGVELCRQRSAQMPLQAIA
ncbi:MAG: 4-hydroxythreonine-4-phosphate dehydrogenase PdxA [Leptolyngbyaceae cyanobacterium SL_1_1]|nr:4-hydroxythreonine-4-phosphate dehydrogenase PdxA [Leptolyngbyaceae cyanobacterium RM1_1_2]NJO10737.1 4-hydroxythreonine-4-phosphate dehydrogenase PdxA [Leptolyngbyaceae cyanobacterium SL_1_1]